MLGKNIIKIIAPALVAAAVAAPIAQAGTGTSDPAGRTEAKGYTAIANYLATRSPVVAQAPDLAGQTEAKGFLAISRYLATGNQSSAQAVDLAGRSEAKGYLAISHYLATRNPVVTQAPNLAGRTEAKGYLGISNYLASQGSTEVAAAQTSSFNWGDAGIGAAFAAGVFLLGAAAGLFLRRRLVTTRLSH